MELHLCLLHFPVLQQEPGDKERGDLAYWQVRSRNPQKQAGKPQHKKITRYNGALPVTSKVPNQID